MLRSSVLLVVVPALAGCWMDPIDAPDSPDAGAEADAAPPPVDAAAATPFVAASGAELPVTVQALLPQGDVWADFFGGAVAMSPDGTVVAVAATRDGGYADADPRGSVYLYEADAAGQMVQVDHLAIDGMHAFGKALATNGKVLAVAADGPTATSPGEVHLYERVAPGAWQPAEVIASPEPARAGFGRCLVFDGHLLLVCGADFVARFGSGPAGWIGIGRIDPPAPPVELGSFATALAVDGDTLVVGDPAVWLDDSRSGVAHVYSRGAGDVWNLVATLPPTMPGTFAAGFRVAAGDGVIAVGAEGWPHRVELFERDPGGGWDSTALLWSGSDVDAERPFGQAMAFSGDRLLIGTGTWVSPPYDDTGHLFQFDRTGDGWTGVGQVIPPDLSLSDNLGFAVAVGAGRAVVGADTDDTVCPSALNCNAGAAYVFTMAP
ncbi:MAG TPA: hypothetical protein VL172_13210 [Kofleriaceae bacterium]|jgi:hypothetical protein|nr:hypothetical protein [Kofleriaceae bacterium]